MTDRLPYAGRHVVVTGAATGIGRETTRLLKAAGARVTALDIRPVDGDVDLVVDAGFTALMALGTAGNPA